MTRHTYGTSLRHAALYSYPFRKSYHENGTVLKSTSYAVKIKKMCDSKLTRP